MIVHVCRHIEHIRDLEQEKERCMSDHGLCQAQLETVTRTVREQDTMLANKVWVGEGGGRYNNV